jgi:hypothetical protein
MRVDGSLSPPPPPFAADSSIRAHPFDDHLSRNDILKPKVSRGAPKQLFVGHGERQTATLKKRCGKPPTSLQSTANVEAFHDRSANGAKSGSHLLQDWNPEGRQAVLTELLRHAGRTHSPMVALDCCYEVDRHMGFNFLAGFA